MSTIKLGDLPSIKQAVTPVNSGEVKLIDAGGLVLPNVGAPVLGTDAANKDYVDASIPLVTPFSVGYSNAVTGVQNVLSIVDSPVLFSIKYSATNSQFDVTNDNSIPSGIVLRVNLFLQSSSLLSGIIRFNRTHDTTSTT